MPENSDTRKNATNPLIGYQGVDLVTPHVLHFWQAQEKALEDAGGFFRRWLDRRQTATRTSMQALATINQSGGDVGAAVKAVSDWQFGAVERVAEDASDWLAFWRDCADHFAINELEAEEEVAEKLGGSKPRKKPTRIPV